MPTLNWIGKEAVVNHHLQVPFHLLKDVPSLACGEPGDGNLIVQGDNLVALKALLPYYAGQVNCIYNYLATGNEGCRCRIRGYGLSEVECFMILQAWPLICLPLLANCTIFISIYRCL